MVKGHNKGKKSNDADPENKKGKGQDRHLPDSKKDKSPDKGRSANPDPSDGRKGKNNI